MYKRQVLGLVINAYGKENITAARAADILVAAVKDGTAEADEFAGVLGRVVPTAATLGVAFDQVTAALAGMTLTGLGAAFGATGALAVAAGAVMVAAVAVAGGALVAVWAHWNRVFDEQHAELRDKSRKFAREATEEGIEAARAAYQKGLDDLARLNMLGVGLPELLWGNHAKLQADYAAFELEIKLMNREVLERVKDESCLLYTSPSPRD